MNNMLTEEDCNLATCGLIQLRGSVVLKEYARAEEVSAGFGVDLVSASDLSCGIGVSETAEY